MSVYPLINRDNSCCFSGYRPEKLPWGADESDPRCDALKMLISNTDEWVFSSGRRHFLCGMARGSDTYFCEAIHFLREKHPEITIEAAIPYRKQAQGWKEEERARYDKLIDLCDYVTYVSEEYKRDCMLRRNRYIVDNSSLLIAVFDGKLGGTSYTMKYAAKRGVAIIDIAPILYV